MTPAILLLLAALAQQPKAHPSAVPPRDPMAEAMKDLDAGKTQQAIATLKEVLAQNPDNYAVWFNLGVPGEPRPSGRQERIARVGQPSD